jgi:hypothetical protein
MPETLRQFAANQATSGRHTRYKIAPLVVGAFGSPASRSDYRNWTRDVFEFSQNHHYAGLQYWSYQFC